MSEIVNNKIIEMIDELNYYKKHNIFSEDKIQTIIDKRKSYEYKLQRNKKLFTDYLNYINFERRLEAKIILQTKSYDNRYIIKRISSLYRRTIRYFNKPEVIHLYVKYLEKRDRHEDVLYFFETHSKMNPCDTDFTIYAAEKCIEYGDYTKGRILLLKGLRENNSKKLLLALCKFEIEFMNHCIKMNEDIGLDTNDYSDVEKGKIVATVVNNYIKQFGRCPEIEKIIDQTSRVPEIQKEIEDSINKQ